MFVAPNQYSPPATPLARPLTKGSDEPFTFNCTVAVPIAMEFGVSVMLLKVGGVRSIKSVALIVVLQFPATSLARTYTVWLPAASAPIVAAGNGRCDVGIWRSGTSRHCCACSCGTGSVNEVLTSADIAVTRSSIVTGCTNRHCGVIRCGRRQSNLLTVGGTLSITNMLVVNGHPILRRP